MLADDMSILVGTRQSAARSDLSSAGARKLSRHVRYCLFLIYYFSFSDFVLKFLPANVAIPLRFLPEILMYLLVACLLAKEFRVLSFPLLWPLVVCAGTMMISGILNASSLLAVLSDFRSYFKFSALSYIAWRTIITPRRIEQFVDGFLGLTTAQLIIGGLELIGGSPVRIFFLPALGWETGAPAALYPADGTWLVDRGSWLSGTLWNYNDYGMFMTVSCVLALTMYFTKKSPKYLWLARLSAVAVLLSISRHSLLLLVVAITILFIFHRREFKVASGLRWITAILVIGSIVLGLSGGADSAIAQRVSSIFSPAVVAGAPADNIRLYMTVVLPPRFLTSYPFFGQGPIPPSDDVLAGPFDASQGPTLKAAPELPAWVTAFVRDVVWVLILGLYGMVGLIAFFFVFWTIASRARDVRNRSNAPEVIAIAEASIAIVAVVCLGGFFSLEIIARDTIPVFWVVAGIILSLYSAVSPVRKSEKSFRRIIFATRLAPA